MEIRKPSEPVQIRQPAADVPEIRTDASAGRTTNAPPPETVGEAGVPDRPSTALYSQVEEARAREAQAKARMEQARVAMSPRGLSRATDRARARRVYNESFDEYVRAGRDVRTLERRARQAEGREAGAARDAQEREAAEAESAKRSELAPLLIEGWIQQGASPEDAQRAGQYYVETGDDSRAASNALSAVKGRKTQRAERDAAAKDAQAKKERGMATDVVWRFAESELGLSRDEDGNLKPADSAQAHMMGVSETPMYRRVGQLAVEVREGITTLEAAKREIRDMGARHQGTLEGITEPSDEERGFGSGVRDVYREEGAEYAEKNLPPARRQERAGQDMADWLARNETADDDAKAAEWRRIKGRYGL